MNPPARELLCANRLLLPRKNQPCPARAKGKAEVIVLEDRNHQTATHLIGAPGDETGAIILQFVASARK